MKDFDQYLIDLVKKAASKLGLPITEIKYDSNSIEFIANGVSMYGVFIRQEGGTRLRLYYNIINKKYDMNNEAALLTAFPIINSFNLSEGGLLQLVLLPNVDEGTLIPVIKAIDIMVTEIVVSNTEVEKYVTNLLIDVLACTRNAGYFVENYVKKLENIQ